ncbi:Fe2+-dependent dioxygenase [Synechococcus elongatus IITB7]|uniref:Fe2+-dependent dioxygenase n=1 Tax=Synechococcus elongatus TaxID=32046 RepID=UPI0030D5948D
MIITIESLLDADQIKLIQSQLATASFVDGRTTAGWHARLVKQNQQLSRTSNLAKKLQEIVLTALGNNALFEAAAYPQRIHSLLFSRYEPGMEYGRHVDNALMGSGDRADLSFTLFLSDPDSYSGGALVIEGACDEQSFRLPAGSLLLYPSSTLHRVEPVEQGYRLACVGWVQSWIRDPAKRELLFDLDTARRSLFAREGKSIEFDLLSKTYANLLRRWLE